MASRHNAILALYRTDVAAFTRFAFAILHPGNSLAWHWYLDIIVDRIDAVLRGRIKRLIINAPPRTLKTLIATLVLIALYLGRNPNKQVLLVVGHAPLASDLMKRLRRLMGSDRYRSLFPNMKLTMAGTTIQTGYGGGVRVTIVGKQISGHGADLVVVDDPLSPSHACDDSARNEVNEWFDSEVLQRLNNRAEGALVLVMQRVHGSDLSGHLKNTAMNFESVVLPSVATSDETWSLADGRCLVRRNGEVLNSNTDSPDQQMELWSQVGSFVYATQYLQCTAGTADGPWKFLYEPHGDDWSPENWSRRGGMRRITLHSRILHYAFGEPLPEHANWLTQPPWRSDEQWEAAAAVHTRRMDELRRDPSTGASWMKVTETT